MKTSKSQLLQPHLKIPLVLACQYEQACQQEEMLYDMMRDAENDMNQYSSMASSSEDASEQRAALEQTKAAALRYQQCQNQLQQVQAAKTQAISPI